MNTVIRIAAAAAFLCVALAGCDSDFDPGSRVTKLRLLSLRADRPFARPGESVELQLLVADAEQRPLAFALGTCTSPRGSTVDSCLAELDAPLADVTPEAGRFAVALAPDLLDDLPESARPSALVGVVVVACPGRIEPGETAGVPVVCRDEAGERLPISEFEVGMKRIFVRERDRNDNPEIERVTWDGEDWPEAEPRSARACPDMDTRDIEDCASALRHRIRVETSEPERGLDENGTRFEEQQVVQFYATQGVFERDVRIAEASDNHWAAQRGAADRATLWFVVRDDRGGVAWTQRQVAVR